MLNPEFKKEFLKQKQEIKEEKNDEDQDKIPFIASLSSNQYYHDIAVNHGTHLYNLWVDLAAKSNEELEEINLSSHYVASPAQRNLVKHGICEKILLERKRVNLPDLFKTVKLGLKNMPSNKTASPKTFARYLKHKTKHLATIQSFNIFNSTRKCRFNTFQSRQSVFRGLRNFFKLFIVAFGNYSPYPCSAIRRKRKFYFYYYYWKLNKFLNSYLVFGLESKYGINHEFMN